MGICVFVQDADIVAQASHRIGKKHVRYRYRTLLLE